MSNTTLFSPAGGATASGQGAGWRFGSIDVQMGNPNPKKWLASLNVLLQPLETQQGPRLHITLMEANLVMTLLIISHLTWLSYSLGLSC